jgi:hypothetical protein
MNDDTTSKLKYCFVGWFNRNAPMIRTIGTSFATVVLLLVFATTASAGQAKTKRTKHETRSYSAISKIMKTKHDTVKNSIANVR